ncbi:nuclear transport factor 2 family protein [Novosphingobium album (ex Hu et al. 2023)]|uniref:Nuclear transport factor 2 family protein n=1 Tax=Novosphingobium album (ex Hu et al. 2023) TaxID=2930093 RepID=A0ABT0B7G0_9SPHN|nr:nuclear transport factor 2 family protein [Novosphingobium album (ex Hu et al. 2023)]MCJ2181011.1 nuclear transport factor 2 family protein [Novosphingobium album (ex Hu et al. 2023)]
MKRKVGDYLSECGDREAIRDCIYRYCRGIDRIDADLILSAYWPDASDEHGNFTAGSAREFVEHAVPILHSIDLTAHFIGNILIDINGDKAFVESYIQAFHRMRRDDGTRYDHMSGSRFIDRMEKREDEWRIARRVVVRDWFREFPDSAEWDTGQLGQALGYGRDRPLDLGLRKPGDRSYALLRR